MLYKRTEKRLEDKNNAIQTNWSMEKGLEDKTFPVQKNLRMEKCL